jgi:hypothetical protein
MMAREEMASGIGGVTRHINPRRSVSFFRLVMLSGTSPFRTRPFLVRTTPFTCDVTFRRAPNDHGAIPGFRR